MRIYFVGSHATGKTTLCRYVSRRFGLPMISEVARAVLAEMETALDALRTDMDLVAEYQERVFARQVAVEQMHDGRFVSDRAFDNLAYVAEHTTNAAAMMNDQRFRDYMKWVSEGVVFFLRAWHVEPFRCDRGRWRPGGQHVCARARHSGRPRRGGRPRRVPAREAVRGLAVPGDLGRARVRAARIPARPLGVAHLPRALRG